MKTFYPDEKNVVMNGKSVERKPCINRESNSDELTIQLYSCHDIHMKFLVVVTPLSIYHDCSTQKTFWEEKFTGKENLFLSVNMKKCARLKVRKHKKIKGSDKIVALNISAKFDSLNKMKTTSSELKGNFGISRKGFVTALALKTKVGSQKYKKAKYAIGIVSEKDLSKIIREFEKIGKVPYVKRITKHEPTSSYFHLVKATCEVYDEI